MTPRLLVTAFTALFTFCIFLQNASAICLPTTVSTFSNELETTVCPSDGEPDVVKFKPNSWATAYRFIVTTEDDIIIASFSGNNYDFETLGGGVSRVYGLSYSGVLEIPLFENINDADFGSFCWIVSDNYVVVNRVIPDGGNPILANGDMTAYICPDGNPDVLFFDNINASIGNYCYFLVDADGIILGISDVGAFNLGSLDFDNLPEGNYFVYGVAYAGELIAQIGDDVNVVDLSDSCFDLSDTAVEVFKEQPEGGVVSLLDGGDFIEICVGDGQPSIVDFEQTNPTNSLYGYLITDENNMLLAVELNDFHDFEGAGAGDCRIYGFAYTGNLTPSDGADIFTFDITDDCYSITSNFVHVSRLQADGGEVMTTDGANLVFFCPDDGVADVLTFESTSIGNVNYTYVVTDLDGEILNFLNSDSLDFDNAGVGSCLVYGLSYLTNLNPDATNIFTDQLADDCYEISTNYVKVTRQVPVAGDIQFVNGDTIAYTCPGVGGQDVLEFETIGNSESNIAYVITNEEGEVLATTASGVWDFEDAPEGICQIYTVSYTGNLLLNPADTLSLTAASDDCFDVSEDFIEVVRVIPNGGFVALENGQSEIYTCPDNGNPDIVEFFNSDASNSPYAYIILDANNIVLDIETSDSHDFDNAPLGDCLVIGVAYTGNITMQIGDDASVADFSDDCFSYSDNLLTIHRVNPVGGTIEFTGGGSAMDICAGDGNADIISIQNVDASVGPYIFIVTDSSDVILGNTFAFNINFDNFASTACRVYGVAFTGDYLGEVGDTLTNIAISDDCFDVTSNFLTISKTYVDGGNLETSNGETSLIICPNDGVPNVIEFTNDSSADEADYQYIITNNQGVILSIPTDNFFNFDPAGIGICKVYGVSYTGTLTAEVDSLITTVVSDDCYHVSDNFIEVIRDQPSGDIIISDLGDEIDFCVNDGQPDVVNFITGSFSFAHYAYLITDENNNVISVEFESFHDFDFSLPGVCRVWGISYTGNLIAGEGDNIDVDLLSDDCFDVSGNFITINKILVDGATIFTPGNADTVYTCPGDGNADFIGLFNTSTIMADYKYVITTDSNIVIDVETFNLYNFENLPEGICRIYGLSHTGVIDIDAGDDLFDTALSDGCFDVSDNFITVVKVIPTAGTITTQAGTTEETITIDGMPDTLHFMNSGSALAKQRYVITDANEVILGITDHDFVDFENAGVGICKVYNLVYSGSLLAEAGDLFLEMAPASGCWGVSDNFVTVNRIELGNNFSNTGGIQNASLSKSNLTITPNPATNFINIDYYSTIENKGQIQIIDRSGKVLFKKKNSFEKGHNTVQIPLNNLEEGLYILTIQNSNEIFHEKFVKD